MRYFSKKRFTMRQVVGLLTVVFLGIAVIAYAAVTVPNIFHREQPISSGQVNANFTALGNAMPAVKNKRFYRKLHSFYLKQLLQMSLIALAVTPPVDGYIIFEWLMVLCRGQGKLLLLITGYIFI